MRRRKRREQRKLRKVMSASILARGSLQEERPATTIPAPSAVEHHAAHARPNSRSRPFEMACNISRVYCVAAACRADVPPATVEQLPHLAGWRAGAREAGARRWCCENQQRGYAEGPQHIQAMSLTWQRYIHDMNASVAAGCRWLGCKPVLCRASTAAVTRHPKFGTCRLASIAQAPALAPQCDGQL